MESAEEAYNLTLNICLGELTLQKPSSRSKVPKSLPETPTENQDHDRTSSQDNPTLPDIPSDLKKALLTALDGVSNLPQLIENLSHVTDQVGVSNIANLCFTGLVKNQEIDSNPADFISQSLTAMRLLQVNGKANLLYKFAFCLSEKRPGTEKPMFQLD